jgi:hypothetical protein
MTDRSLVLASSNILRDGCELLKSFVINNNPRQISA